MDNIEHDTTALRLLDPTIFTIESQTSTADRRSLLAIQNVVRDAAPDYAYGEVGSHLGGTLVPHLRDPICRLVLSVDKRPASQWDERGRSFDYVENSTQRMLDTLKDHVPDATLGKLRTFDSDISELPPAAIAEKIDLSLIDAEHTNAAVFRDFLGIQKFLATSYVVAFHDANLLGDGLQNIENLLRHQGIEYRSFFLPEVVFVIATGDFIGCVVRALAPMSLDRDVFLHQSRLALWREIAGNVEQRKDDGELRLALHTPVAEGGQRPTLTALANWYGSDKGTSVVPAHRYSLLYDLLFDGLRDRPLDLLEIGLAVGGPELGNAADRFAISPSVQMWLSYFSRATIHGFDITDFSHMQHPRFRFTRGDCGNGVDLQALRQTGMGFDIIIDDASHASFHQQNTFHELFPALRPGGLYIIEDLHWQSPHFEDALPSVPKTGEFFREFFESGSYGENPLLSRNFMESARREIYSFTLFPDFTGQVNGPKLIVIKKTGDAAWASDEPNSARAVTAPDARAELASLEARIAGLEAMLTDTGARLAERDARLAALEAGLAKTRADNIVGLTALRSALPEIRARAVVELSGVRAITEATAARLVPLEAQVAEATDTLDQLKTGVETWLLPKLATHDAAIARLRKWRRRLFPGPKE